MGTGRKNDPGRKPVDGLVREKELYEIPFAELFGTGCFLPVQRYVFLAEHLIEEALRRLIHIFPEKFVEALSGFICSDGDLPHGAILLSFFRICAALPPDSQSESSAGLFRLTPAALQPDIRISERYIKDQMTHSLFRLFRVLFLNCRDIVKSFCAGDKRSILV